jgi:hypothetical protein
MRDLATKMAKMGSDPNNSMRESAENDGDRPRDLEYDVPDKTLAGLGP